MDLRCPINLWTEVTCARDVRDARLDMFEVTWPAPANELMCPIQTAKTQGVT